MDYEEFVVQFRARAAVRMQEFEKALAKAQADTAKAKEQTIGQANSRATAPLQPVTTHGSENHKTQATASSKKTSQPAGGRARGRGPVQSILRKA